MRKSSDDAEWDVLWATHDQRLVPAPVVAPDAAPQKRSNLRLKHWLMLALAFFALPLPGQLLSADGTTGALPREAIFSLSPIEVALPPLDASIARLAAESASASCWVMELRPQGGGCATAVVTR